MQPLITGGAYYGMSSGLVLGCAQASAHAWINILILAAMLLNLEGFKARSACDANLRPYRGQNDKVVWQKTERGYEVSEEGMERLKLAVMQTMEATEQRCQADYERLQSENQSLENEVSEAHEDVARLKAQLKDTALSRNSLKQLQKEETQCLHNKTGY